MAKRPLYFTEKIKAGCLSISKGSLLLFAVLLLCSGIRAQDAMPPDSVLSEFLSRVRKIGDDEAKRSVVKFKEAKTTILQDELIDAIKETTLKAKSYMKGGLDTAMIYSELKKIDRWYETAGEGIFNNKESAQTYRNLTTTSKILSELLIRTAAHKKVIDKQEKDLIVYRYKIDSLSSNPGLYSFPTDSLSAIEYMQKLIVVVKGIGPADSALKHSISNLHQIQLKVDQTIFRLSGSLEEIEGYQRMLSARMFNREFGNLTGVTGDVRPFQEILSFSKEKGALNFFFYAQNYFTLIILTVLAFIGGLIFLKSLKKMLIEQKLLNDDYAGQLVFRYPALSALVIALNLFQFIFPAPPFIFNCLFWLTTAVALTFIFRGVITQYWMRFWVLMLILFAVSCAGNLVLQASRMERWLMLIVAAIGVFIGLMALIRKKKHELKEKLILYFIGLMVVLELISIIANVFGRYNFSKALLVGGYLNVVIGILFLWTIRFINEGLSLASKVYTRQEKKLFYINFNAVGEKVPAIFYFFLVLGWLILFGRNFYVFQLITDPLKEFFFSERTVGSYSFTIINLVIFILILSLSVIISKVVSFFASDKQPVAKQGNERKAGVGSWLLLIRVFIISTGSFLALAASGFPLERITIIIGALGVGIGFGLQTIVNNLVSGLIIAFEKPVNVGDFVEIGGHAGTMKSIGFRSSVIAQLEGADVVIPNGDLLNSHLVNWTLAGGKKQINLLVGVAYGTELETAKQLLMNILIADERILKYPPPAAAFQEFNNSSIDIKLYFWVHNFREALTVKSDVISAIDATFREKGISIPFPQQELHIIQTEKKEPPTGLNESQNET